MSEPTPGSPKAVERGCTCPVRDNAHGQGVPAQADGSDRPMRHFWITAQCPVHDPSSAPEKV